MFPIGVHTAISTLGGAFAALCLSARITELAGTVRSMFDFSADHEGRP
jgi:hypothetical protein